MDHLPNRPASECRRARIVVATVCAQPGPARDLTGGRNLSVDAAMDAAVPRLYKVQLRTNPYLTDTGSWGEPLPTCDGEPAFKEVVVTTRNLKIQNSQQFSMWLNVAKRCSEGSVFWVSQVTPLQTKNTMTTEAGMYAIYDVLREEVPEGVLTGAGGVPLRFVK